MKKSKNFEDLVFSDDFMFGKVMEDKQLCREVLTCLLQRNAYTTLSSKAEKMSSGGHSI